MDNETKIRELMRAIGDAEHDLDRLRLEAPTKDCGL